MGRTEAKMSLPSELELRQFLQKVLPGKSQRIAQLREEILDFSVSPTTRTVLLLGPIGAGKSTIARIIALLKRIAPLRPKAAAEIIKDVAFERPGLIKTLSLPWYVELPLTGLATELAELQLFGSSKGAFTGATDRAGVFEQAMFGRRKRDVDARSEAVRMTGGVVFLDEIGDLLPAHQAKLLPVLSGGAFYRLGEEGQTDKELTFRGILITATWKTLAGGLLRGDLLSRIGTNRIRVPGLSDRMEDFPELLSDLEESVRQHISVTITSMVQVESLAATDYWNARQLNIPRLESDDRRYLASIDWSKYGNLRGLTAVVELILTRGVDAKDALGMQPAMDCDTETGDLTSVMIDDLLRRSPSANGLAGHISALEHDYRSSLRDRLRSDPALLARLAAQLGIAPDTLSYQVQQLARDRTRRRPS